MLTRELTVLRYSYDVQGIPLSYNNLSVTSLQARAPTPIAEPTLPCPLLKLHHQFCRQ